MTQPFITLRVLGDLLSPCHSHGEVDTEPRSEAERKDKWFHIRLTQCDHGCGIVDALHGGEFYGLGPTRVKAVASLMDAIHRGLDARKEDPSEGVTGLIATMLTHSEEALEDNWQRGSIPNLNRGYENPKKKYSGEQTPWFSCGVKLRDEVVLNPANTRDLIKMVSAPLRAPTRVKHDTHEGALAVYIDWAANKGCDFAAEDLYIEVRNLANRVNPDPRLYAVAVKHTPSYVTTLVKP